MSGIYLSENFHSLGLSEKVIDAVARAGYERPTEIQAEAIPHVLAKRDLIGIAQTGTGKTASFVLPMLTLLEKGRARARMPRTLILEPTRELAAQVFENFEKYGANHRLSVALLIGGVSFVEQNKILSRGADVLIATPGRLLDHFERGRLLMTGTEIFVIDEADRMLDMGFIPDIEKISSLLPSRRQTLFFSATMPEEIRKLSERFLRDPVQIKVSRKDATADTIEQRLVRTGGKPAEKRSSLRAQIDGAKNLTNAIIFCNRKRDIATLTRSLIKHGYDAGALHGDMDQRSRTETLNTFRDGKLKLLIASDVAARGLDIPDVSHVFNFDVPSHAEDYVHRIGRTGRAGRSGAAITLVSPADSKYLNAIEKLIGRKIDWQQAEATPVEKDAQQPAVGKSQDTGKKDAGKSHATHVTDGEQEHQSREPRGRKRHAHKKPAAQPVHETSAAPVTSKTAQGQTSQNKKTSPKHDNMPQPKSASKTATSSPFGDKSNIPAFLLRSITQN